MTIDEEFLKKVVQCGTLAYPLSRIINVLDIDDVPAFTKEFDTLTSKIAQAYRKGVDMADFIIDSKLFEKAKGGDLSALRLYEQRKEAMILQGKKEENQRKRAIKKQTAL